jgi:DNA polymerase
MSSDILNSIAPCGKSVVILDFETRSQLDLRKVGAWRYAEHPSTDVLCAAYAIGDGPVELWVPGEPVPPAIIAAAADPVCRFVAHNAAFERIHLEHVLAPRHGWPLVPFERWRCSMIGCLMRALPASLKRGAQVLGLKHQKADDKIMHLTCKPRLPRAGEDPAQGPYWFDDAERLGQLYEYCRQDVEVERELWRWLSR